MGIGYFYTKTDSGDLLTQVGIANSTQGAEAFYNIAVTPSSRLTLNAQWLEADVPGAKNAWVLGARAAISF
jgi:hypothetical protein